MKSGEIKIKNGRLDAAGKKLSKEDFNAIVKELSVTPGFAVKAADKPVAAMRVVDTLTRVTTFNTKNGTVQAKEIAQPGDAIMTHLDKDGRPKFGETGELDQWVVKAKNIERLSNLLGKENEYGQIVGGNNEVYYVELPNGGIIEGPWGSRQEISSGVLEYNITIDEVYLNEEASFSETFNVQKRPEKMIRLAFGSEYAEKLPSFYHS